MTRARTRLAALVLGFPLALLAGCGDGAEPASSDAATGPAADGFPVTVEHAFGSTTIEQRPQRVVTAGFNEQDFSLALGVTPVGVREFLGYDAHSRPWAQDLLPAEEIPTVGAEELNLEQVAALEPDVILAVNAYIDERTYDLLSQVAPTVAQPAEYADGDTPWQEQTLLTGRVLGVEAEAVVTETEQAFEAAVDENPDFAGSTASFALGGAYSLGADDYRTQWLTELGFEVPEKGGEVSEERLEVFDTDVLLLEGVTDDLLEDPVFTGLDAVEEGRVVDLGPFDTDFAGALGFNSPLSLPFVLDVAVPRLAEAVDGDPATEVTPYPEQG